MCYRKCSYHQRRSHKMQVNIKDFLKDVLKLLHINAHFDISYINFGRIIFLVQSYSFLQFGWKLSNRGLISHANSMMFLKKEITLMLNGSYLMHLYIHAIKDKVVKMKIWTEDYLKKQICNDSFIYSIFKKIFQRKKRTSDQVYKNVIILIALSSKCLSLHENTNHVQIAS